MYISIGKTGGDVKPYDVEPYNDMKRSSDEPHFMKIHDNQVHIDQP